MADKKLTEVTTATSSNSNDFVVLIQSNAVKKIELSKLNVGISEERITQIRIRHANFCTSIYNWIAVGS